MCVCVCEVDTVNCSVLGLCHCLCKLRQLKLGHKDGAISSFPSHVQPTNPSKCNALHFLRHLPKCSFHSSSTLQSGYRWRSVELVSFSRVEEVWNVFRVKASWNCTQCFWWKMCQKFIQELTVCFERSVRDMVFTEKPQVFIVLTASRLYVCRLCSPWPR